VCSCISRVRKEKDERREELALRLFEHKEITASTSPSCREERQTESDQLAGTKTWSSDEAS
jgi:hypothetical protein